MKYYLSYIFGLSLLIFNYSNSRTITPSNIDNNDNNDKYYLIYVNNPHGEYEIFSNTKYQKRQESQIFIESLVDEINSLIIKNKDTYQNPEKLNEIEETSKLNKRRKRNIQYQPQEYYTYDESDFVYPISSIKDRVILYAYLSNSLTNEIQSKFSETIINIVPNRIRSTFNHQNYNVDEILAQTHWKNLTVRENADFHLSLISQGKQNSNEVNQYDNNYYYPYSAGKDVDIVILDSSFHFDYSEFSNREDRIIKCAGNVKNGKVTLEGLDENGNGYCGKTSHCHGEIVSDTAAGLIHGVASRANVYGISLPSSLRGGISDSDIIGGVQYIYEKMIRPHKTVVNFSIGGAYYEYEEYYYQYQSLVDSITEKGGIVVAAAGNQGYDLREQFFKYVPCEFDNVICVGGIANDNNEKSTFNNVYNIHSGSNFGRGVNLYAPFQVEAEIVKNDQIEKVKEKGTSYSSPIVAGIIATIIGENPEIEYTKETIYNKLYENGQYEKITTSGVNSFLANNGKRIVYYEP